MPWRVIACGDDVWHVAAVAQRPPHMVSWQLVLSFRGTSGKVRDRSFWAAFPLEATSKSALFLQAEQIPDKALAHLVAGRVA